MTRVCLVGEDDVDVRYELFSRETARAALSTYSPGQPYENTLAVETVSLGAAVALLNDLNWYLARFVDAALVREPSISEKEWLSRDLATAVRNDEVDPDETGDLLTVYGVDDDRLVEPMYVARSGVGTPGAGPGRSDAATADGDPGRAGPGTPGVEPHPDDAADGASGGDAATETATTGSDAEGRDRPAYDLREVEETVVVRVTEAEFAG